MIKGILSAFKSKEKNHKIVIEGLSFLSPKIYPIEEAKKTFKNHFEKLHSAIHSKGVNNIAITGAYGSGKTTILKNYQNAYSERQYLNISLATFKEEEEEEELPGKDQSGRGDKTERLIELSILQQILYKVEPSVIPNSNIKRISSMKQSTTIFSALFLVIWLFCITVLFKFNNFHKLNPYGWNDKNDFDWLIFIVALIFIIGVLCFINKGIKVLSGTKISKFKFLENELELGKDINKSILNEHIDEIIYFFQNTKYDVVVFEDIDRFENTEIFTKLREINLIINSSKLINRALNKIVFVYAIRDDKFKTQERTKFFDYILPVIPFISPTNSNEQLWKLVKKEGLKDVFSSDFINDVTTLVDIMDMRLLTNVFNEFIIYKTKVLPNDDNKERNNSLLALMIYKNINPKDFAELSQNRGVIYDIINGKQNYIKKKISEVDKQIDAAKDFLNNVEKERISSVDELKSIYINAVYKKFTNAISLYLGNQRVAFSELQNDEVFEKFIKSEGIGYYENVKANYNDINIRKETLKNVRIPFSEIESIVNVDFSYEDRKEFINNKSSKSINALKVKIEKLELKKEEIESWDLFQVYNALDTSPINEKHPNYKLINYLILNGYINEKYHHYISIFHAENLSIEDFDFEKKVKSGENGDFGFRLNKIDNLLKKLDKKYFQRDVILNFDLVNHLLTHSNIYAKKVDVLIKQLSNNESRSISFINAYIDSEENKQKSQNEGVVNLANNINLFIRLLSKNWSNFWYFIEFDSSYTDDKKKRFLKYIVLYSDVEDIRKLDYDLCLSAFIEKEEGFFKLFENGDFAKVKNVISELGIEFLRLKEPEFNEIELFDFVYSNNTYRINMDNISTILNYKQLSLDKSYYSSHYRFLLNSECDNLIDYINEDVNSYIENVYLKIKEDNYEVEDVLVENIYNNNDIEVTLKLEVVKKTSTKIQFISKVNNLDLKRKLIKFNKVKATWSNVYFYISDYEGIFIDDVLIDFYNFESNYKELSIDKLHSEELNDFYRGLRFAILKCEKLNIKAYKYLLKSINKIYSDLNFEKISSDKVDALLGQEKLSFSKENYNRLKQYFPNKHIQFIVSFFKDFITIIGEVDFDENDFLLLLKSKKLSHDDMAKLIKIVDEKYIIESIEASEIVCSFLSRSDYYKLNFELLNAFINSESNLIEKLNLLLKHILFLSKEEVVSLLKCLPEPYFKLTEQNKRPSFVNSSVNWELLSKLESIDLVYPYKQAKNRKIKVTVK